MRHSLIMRLAGFKVSAGISQLENQVLMEAEHQLDAEQCFANEPLEQLMHHARTTSAPIAQEVISFLLKRVDANDLILPDSAWRDPHPVGSEGDILLPVRAATRPDQEPHYTLAFWQNGLKSVTYFDSWPRYHDEATKSLIRENILRKLPGCTLWSEVNTNQRPNECGLAMVRCAIYCVHNVLVDVQRSDIRRFFDPVLCLPGGPSLTTVKDKLSTQKAVSFTERDKCVTAETKRTTFGNLRSFRLAENVTVSPKEVKIPAAPRQETHAKKNQSRLEELPPARALLAKRAMKKITAKDNPKVVRQPFSHRSIQMPPKIL